MTATLASLVLVAATAGCQIGHCPSVGPEDPPLWRIRVGIDYDYDVAVDPAGDLLIAEDVFETAGVRKWRPDGSEVWTGCTDAGGPSEVTAVAVGGDGDLVVAYQRFSNPQITSSAIAKCSGVDGAQLWSRTYTSGIYLTTFGLAIDPAGNVVLGGYVRDTADFGGGPIGAVDQDSAFLVELDPDGGHRWSRADPNGTYDSIAIVDGGDVVAAMSDVGGTAIARFAGSDGAEAWRAQLGGMNCFQPTPLAVGDGRVFVTGHDGCQEISTATLFALDAASGDESWRASFAGPYLTAGGVAADDGGTVAVVTYSPAYVKVRDQELCLEQQGEGLVYLTRFDALSGALGPSARIGLPELDGRRGISLAPDGSWIIAGSRLPGPDEPDQDRQALLSAHAH